MKGIQTLVELCERDDILDQMEWISRATQELKLDGENGSRALAQLIKELLDCRSSKLLDVLITSFEVTPTPELIEVLKSILENPAVYTTSRTAFRFSPQLIGKETIGWTDLTYQGIRHNANMALTILRGDTKKDQKEEHIDVAFKQTDIYEILMDAICCVMYADGKVMPKEREASHRILVKTKVPWTKEDVDKRIDGFLERTKKEGMEKIVQSTCANLPEFKRRKKQEVLKVCLDFMARADGIADENEKKLIEKFKSAVEIGSTDSVEKVSPDAISTPAKNTDAPSRPANISEKPVPQYAPVKQYNRKPHAGGCPVCGGTLAKRIVPNSITGNSTPTSWHWEVKITEMCIKCHPQPCMVAGCPETATEVLTHKYEMGKGRARVGFRNDVFICATHLAPIKKYRFFNLLGQISIFAWMGIGFAGAIIGGIAIGKTIFQYWWYLLFIIPCIAVLLYADKWKLAKKEDYHMAGFGQYGSQGADDDFSAPMIE